MGFTRVIEIVLKHEGGYVDHADDRGGRTNWGITEKVARQAGYEGHMRDLSREEAIRIYKKNYWDPLRLNEINSEALRLLVFDTGVNMGPGTAVRKLQKTYNLLASNDITVDGIIGPQTIGACNSYRDPDIFNFTYLVMRGERYFNIVRRNKSQRSFILGWMRRLKSFTAQEEAEREMLATIDPDTAAEKTLNILKDLILERW